MYIIKNAIRNITRSKGRNLLIGCIALVIGLSSCLALSIKNAADTAKEEGLQNVKITANIGVDRMAMMEKAKTDMSEAPSGKPSDMKEALQQSSELSLSELQTYAKASSVESFYYTLSTSLNGVEDSFEAVDTSASTDTNDEGGKEGGMGGEPGGQGGGMTMNSADFTITGYSSHAAMTDFQDGAKTIEDGEVFAEEESSLQCLISEELAAYNSKEIGDTFTLVNPNDTSASVTFTIKGIYSTTESSTPGMRNPFQDPANQIYVSYSALSSMISKQSSSDNALSAQTEGTYVFADLASYEAFESEVRELGLSEEYTVSSSDITAFEQSLQPLENLGSYASTFLIVILVVGGLILVALNIFNIRERKYEIGVLAAIGMNKVKVASQFVFELFVIMVTSIVIGAGIGAVVSVPTTNALLSSESTSTQTSGFMQDEGGRQGGKEDKGGMMGITYISEISSATDLGVIFQLVGIGILLTMISSGAAVSIILRYDPLKILSNRE